MGTSRCEFKSFIESLEVGLSRLKMIAIYFVYHISSNKRPQYLFNFEALRCCAYWRSAFKRGRLLFQGGAYFPLPDFAFILRYLFCTIFYNLNPSLKQLKLIIRLTLKQRIIIVVTRKVTTQVHRLFQRKRILLSLVIA